MFGLDIGLVLTVCGSLFGVMSWYRSLTRSQYAHEREYLHIMRNLEQQSKAVADIADQVDELGDRQSRLETLILARFKGGAIDG